MSAMISISASTVDESESCLQEKLMMSSFGFENRVRVASPAAWTKLAVKVGTKPGGEV